PKVVTSVQVFLDRIGRYPAFAIKGEKPGTTIEDIGVIVLPNERHRVLDGYVDAFGILVPLVEVGLACGLLVVRTVFVVKRLVFAKPCINGFAIVSNQASNEPGCLRVSRICLEIRMPGRISGRRRVVNEVSVNDR